jgi:glycine/D-amino acid oxidase-like deaminating enzyme
VQAPELSPVLLAGPALRVAEPALALDLVACRLSTGYPVPPAAGTRAYATRARRAGATIRIGRRAELWVDRGRARGIVIGGERIAAGRVLVAAGPDSPRVVAGRSGWRPIVPVWGVNVDIALPSPPRYVLEEAGVESVARTPIAVGRLRESGAGSFGSRSDRDVPSIFSLVTVRGGSTLGSTFLPSRPDPARLAPELQRRGARFVPSLAKAPIRSARACARPQSADGRPLLGAVPGIEQLFIAAGHGPWGISLGPASAEVVVEMMLGRRTSVAPETDVARFGVPPVPDGH